MLWVVRFYDKPDVLAIRLQKMQAHLAWLDAMQEVVRVAGSLREIPDGHPQGGLWLVEAQSREEVETVLRADPFWLAGLRERVEIHFWAKAFSERKTLI